jgi:hypothetical protein
MALYGATGDERIPQALCRHYLSNSAAHCDERNVCNVEAMLWAYERTGDRRLLDVALEAYEEYNRRYAKRDTTVTNMLSRRRGTEHGVTYNEIGKLAALVAVYTGRRRYLAAAVNAYRKIDRFHMLVDGVCSSSEQLRGQDPLDSHETCDIADYAWSVGYLLMATGRAEYADKIERACFNAAPGAVSSDFKALQYFSCPNQVLADRTSNHNLYQCGLSWMAYRPNHDTECCPGEVHRIMPNYAARQWMSDAGGGLVAALYGPSRVTTAVGSRGQEITIVEETEYPFSDRIEFQIRTSRPVAFSFWVRIPGWCTSAAVLVNGQRLMRRLPAGTFVKIARTFRHNDRISVILPMKLRLSRWPRGGIAVERGPLVYALRIEEDWRISPIKEKCSPRFPAWDVYPASPWNYALALNEQNLERSVEVQERPLAGDPWSIDTAPVVLRAPARRVAGWGIQRLRSIQHQYYTPAGLVTERRKGAFRFTPQLPDPETLPNRLSKRLETVTLVPYGCTHLRITVFPQCS